MPSLTSASRTLSVLSASLTASFRRATTAGGVPVFTKMPAQSSVSSVQLGARRRTILRPSYDLVFPLLVARGQAEMQALIRSAVPLTGIPPPDALFSRLHFSVQAGSF